MGSPDIKLIQYFNDHWYRIDRYAADGALDTRFYPSVTTKLGAADKGFLARWRGDIGNREADMRLFEAQMKGKRIHYAWEILTKGGAVIYNPWDYPIYNAAELLELVAKYPSHVIVQYQEEMMDILKLQKLTTILKPKFVASEIRVFSDEFLEAGTIDNILEIKEGYYLIAGKTAIKLQGGLWVADLKTGGVYSDQAAYQMASYASMYEKLTGHEIIGTLGLHTQGKTRYGIPGFMAYPRTRNEWISEDFQAYREIAKVWERANKEKQPENLEFPSIITLN